MSQFMIIRHDCEMHTHDFSVYGPFDTAEEANTFIDKYELFMPTDGGYAFATVVPADDREMEDPVEYAEEMAGIYDEEVTA